MSVPTTGGVAVPAFDVRGKPIFTAREIEYRARHQELTEYLLEAGWMGLLQASLQLALKHPLRYLRAKRLAWRTSQPGFRGRLRQLAYFLEAAYLAVRLTGLRIQHLHNHIGENSATVAMLAAMLTPVVQ